MDFFYRLEMKNIFYLDNVLQKNNKIVMCEIN